MAGTKSVAADPTKRARPVGGGNGGPVKGTRVTGEGANTNKTPSYTKPPKGKGKK